MCFFNLFSIFCLTPRKHKATYCFHKLDFSPGLNYGYHYQANRRRGRQGSKLMKNTFLNTRCIKSPTFLPSFFKLLTILSQSGAKRHLFFLLIMAINNSHPTEMKSIRKRTHKSVSDGGVGGFGCVCVCVYVFVCVWLPKESFLYHDTQLA